MSHSWSPAVGCVLNNTVWARFTSWGVPSQTITHPYLHLFPAIANVIKIKFQYYPKSNGNHLVRGLLTVFLYCAALWARLCLAAYVLLIPNVVLSSPDIYSPPTLSLLPSIRSSITAVTLLFLSLCLSVLSTVSICSSTPPSERPAYDRCSWRWFDAGTSRLTIL